jgi:hypothetical protein
LFLGRQARALQEAAANKTQEQRWLDVLFRGQVAFAAGILAACSLSTLCYAMLSAALQSAYESVFLGVDIFLAGCLQVETLRSLQGEVKAALRKANRVESSARSSSSGSSSSSSSSGSPLVSAEAHVSAAAASVVQRVGETLRGLAGTNLAVDRTSGAAGAAEALPAACRHPPACALLGVGRSKAARPETRAHALFPALEPAPCRRRL